VSGDNLEEIEPLLSWYKRTGRVQVESLGLDGRTVILKIEGKKRNIRSLVALYDSSLDGDLSTWLRDLIDSHRRAGIEFDRVEIWTSPEMVDDLSAESEELGEDIDIVIRSLSELGSPVSPTLTTPSKERTTSRRARKPSLRKEESRTIVVVEERKEHGSRYEEPNRSMEDSLTAILNEIKRTIDQSMKSIVEEVRKGNEIDLLNKIHELEKRVELLEAMIRLLGQQGTINLPQGGWAARNSVLPKLEPTEIKIKSEYRREQPAGAEAVRTREEERAESAPRYSHQVNIPYAQESGGSEESPTTESEDILEEILSNPWVEILRKKGEDVEG